MEDKKTIKFFGIIVLVGILLMIISCVTTGSGHNPWSGARFTGNVGVFLSLLSGIAFIIYKLNRKKK